MEYTYDTQLLIEGKNLSDEKIIKYINENIEGDCLLVVGDDELIKIHFHTNTPWKVLEYCAGLGKDTFIPTACFSLDRDMLCYTCRLRQQRQRQKYRRAENRKKVS